MALFALALRIYITRIIGCWFCLLLISCGGGGGSASAPDSGDNGGGQPPDQSCTTSLDSYIENLHNEVPSWEQLECFTNDLQRLTLPSFSKRMLDSISEINSGNIEQAASMALQSWDQLYTDYGANLSSAFKAGPPYTTENGNDLSYPLDSATADYVFRGSALLYIKEKQLGRPVVFTHFYPISDVPPTFSSQAEFQQWFDEQLIPEQILAAQTAEKIKAEFFIPFPIEFEIFFKKYTEYGEGGFIDAMSQDEIVAFGQALLDQIAAAVRPHYDGVLVAHTYNSVAGQDTFLAQMTYAAFDILYIALFPQCDIATTESYLDDQLDYYMPIIQRDGLAWQASEITVFPHLFDACDNVNFADIEAEIYQTVFSKLDAAAVTPVGVQIGAYTLETEEAKQVIRDYFNQN